MKGDDETLAEVRDEGLRFIEGVNRGEDELRRGTFLTDDQVGERPKRRLHP